MSIPNNPNKYLGTRQYLIPYVTRNRQPTLADYRQPETGANYPLGCVWQVGKSPSTGVEGELWMLSKIVANQGYWVLVSSSSGNVVTLSDDVDTIVFPDGTGNIQLVGHVNEQGSTKFSTVVAGTNLLNINPMSASRWIVDPLGFNGTHTTITSALASATAGDTILLMEGLYTENFTAKPGVNITAYSGSSSIHSEAVNVAVTIKGKVSITQTGSYNFSNIRFESNGDACIAVSGAVTVRGSFNECYLNVINNTGITSSTANCQLEFNQCWGVVDGTSRFFAFTAGSLSLNNSLFGSSGTAVASTLADSALEVVDTLFISIITTSGNSVIASYNSVFGSGNNVAIALTGTTSFTDYNGRIVGNGATGLTIGAGCFAYLSGTVVSGGVTPITGAGTLNATNIAYDGLTFGDTVTNHDYRWFAIGQAMFQASQSFKHIAPGAYPYSVLITDYAVEVDTSSARTINLPANARDGQSFVIKDVTGNAGVNHITIASGLNIDGSASVSISENYGSKTVYYNSTLNTYFTLNTQPVSSFAAQTSASQANATGDGTAAILICNSEFYDTYAEYDTGTGYFTAKQTAKYQFNVTVTFGDLDVTHTGCTIHLQIGTAPTTLVLWQGNPGAIRDAGNILAVSGSAQMSMQATDTAHVIVTVSGGAKVVDFVGNAANTPPYCSFSACILDQ